MHEKYKTLRLETIFFRVMGPRNVIGGDRDLYWTYHLHLPTACEDTPRMLLQNIHNLVPDYMIS